MINNRIFREYDIRGIYNEDLTDEAAFIIGRAFAFYLREKLCKPDITISVGRDVRLSSNALKSNIVKSLLENNINVIDIGECPTPLQYFSLYRFQTDGGVMITGSHNPPEYNGFKLSLGNQTMFGDDIQEIRSIIKRDQLQISAVTNSLALRGRIETYDIINDYVNYMLSRFHPFDGIRVVIDSGNGTAGMVVPEIMKRLGANVIELYSEPDGNFPNHHPDPVVLDNIKELRDVVVKEKAHLGIGFDGDADRIGVVDENGKPIWGDELMILFSRDILNVNPQATIIGEVKCSQRLFDDIAKNGGRAIMWKTGHSLIKDKMKEDGALLAGEMSGHIFFADRYLGYDDAIYAALRLLEIVKKAGLPYGINKLLADIPAVYSTPEIRFECPDEKKFHVVKLLKTAFEDYPRTTIDGIRINFPNGWGLVRASNTQPALVMRFEAHTQDELLNIERVVRENLNRVLSMLS